MYDQARNKATQRYQKKALDQINFRVKKGEKEQYTEAAAALGLSLAQFFTTAAKEKMERELHG